MKNSDIHKKSTLFLDAAEKYQSDMVKFLVDLVNIPSVNGRDPEAPLAHRIEQEARLLGFDYDLIALQPDRPNALVSYGTGPECFAIIAHIDTVGEGNLASWTTPVFGGEIKDGLILGRGAADNKAGIACGLYTLAVLRDLHLIDPQHQKVIVAGVVDEESGACSPLGVRHLLNTGALKARGAIYAYTSDIVCTGHRGLIRLEIKAHGKSIHAGVAEWHNKTQGANAVMALADLLLKMESINIQAQAPAGFEHLGFTITPGTIFTGGNFPSIVPDLATAVVDIRLLPSQSADEVIQIIQNQINTVEQSRPRISFEMKTMVQIPGAYIPQDHPLAVTAQDYTEAVTGKRWETAGAGPGNEGYMLIEAGIPTLCGFGPTGGNAHAPDEWVEIKSLPATVAIFAGIIHDYLGAS